MRIEDAVGKVGGATPTSYVQVSGGGGGGGGDASAANQLITNTEIGATNEASAAADNSTSGLNGLIKRLLARLTVFMAQLPTTLGQKTMANSLAVTLASDQSTVGVTPAATENHLGEVGGKLIRVAGTFTRPADTTPYTAGDVVSNNATTTTPIVFAGLARVNQGSFYIVSAVLATDKKSITPRFRVHLFTDNTATLAGDNLPYKELYADSGKGHRYFDLPAMITGADTANSDMSKAQDNTLRVPMIAASGTTTIYVVLETLDAFTPASGQNFSLSLQVDTN